MDLKRPLSPSLGVEPEMRFSATVYVGFLFRRWGAPGDMVTVQAGITKSEPLLPRLVGDHVDSNSDKSNQFTRGRDAGVVSDTGNRRPCENLDTRLAARTTAASGFSPVPALAPKG